MVGFEKPKFNTILKKIIKNSLFTERQIEIILNQKHIQESKFDITKGAYYRQVAQSRKKLVSLFYTIVLLRSLGILLPDDMDVMSRLAEQISVIRDSDVFSEKEEEVMDVFMKVIHQTCNL